MGDPQISIFLWFLQSKCIFAENQNGPYGPYEQLLKDGKGNYWQKNEL